MNDQTLTGQCVDKVFPSTCEVISCSAKATMKTEVKVGKLGKIWLYLCNDCCRKFQDSKSEERAVQ